MIKSIRYNPIEAPKFRATVISPDAESQLGFNPKEFYKEIFASLRQEFGKKSLAYNQTINGINPKTLTGSKFLFNNYLNRKIKEKFPSKSVITLKDIEGILRNDATFFNGFYSYAPSVVLRTERNESWEGNQRIINYLVNQLGNKYEFSPENPLIITNPKIIRDKNTPGRDYGLLLEIDEDTLLENDSRLTSGKGKIELGNIEKILLTKPTGLSWLCIDEGGLNAKYGGVGGSSCAGNIVIVDKI